MARRAKKWQAKFKRWIGQADKGLIFAGARRNSRGEWMEGEDTPEVIREHLRLVRGSGAAARWYCPEWSALLEERSLTGLPQRAAWKKLELLVWFEVFEPQDTGDTKKGE